MPIPLEVVDRAKLLTEEDAEHLRERTDKLAHVFEAIRKCRVNVDGPGEHPLQGRVRVRVSVFVPGGKIAVDRQCGGTVAIAIRESFDAAEERLGDHAGKGRNARRSAKKRSTKRT